MRREIHTENLGVPIDQFSDLVGDDALHDRGGKIVKAEGPLNKDYLDELAFNEEPVTIRLEPSTDKNASMWFPVWVNGKGAEVLINDRWIEFGHLPVGVVLVIKRKYVESILRAKVDVVSTEVIERNGENPQNKVKRFTSSVHSFSVLRDKNPLGVAWLEEVRRRNM